MLVGNGVRTTSLPSGEAVPILGQGTWHMGEKASRGKQEVAALRAGLDLGLTLIDTAEMYADGGAEKVVGEAIAGRRDDVFLVSKVLPQNSSRAGTVAACERSLKRLRTDRIDLYLLHWQGKIPVERTLEGFNELVEKEKIRYWGVSNFDVADMEDVFALPGGESVATDQVLYNLTRRGIEYDLLPWCTDRNIPIMAYSPIEQGRLLNKRALAAVGERHEATPAQVALAWVLRENNVIAIPQSAEPDHIRENRAALDLKLTGADIKELDGAFPPPRRKRALEMI